MTRSLLVAVLGPTATGKSALGLALAERYGGEIVNCDSTAVYRGFDIGTDKVPVEERRGVPHHLIDIVEPTAEYTAARYASDAAAAVRDIDSRGRLPILVGGTGLYYRALTRGLFPGPGRDARLRQRLERVAQRRGASALHRLLQRADPESALRIMPRDVKRMIRALEVYYLTGRPLTSHFADTRAPLPEFDVMAIGLRLPAALIAARVERRVDAQYASGLMNEIRRLLAAGVPETARPFGGLVYRQALEQLHAVRGEASTRALIAQENRRYARRQAIWFRREPDIVWLDGPGESLATITAACRLLDNRLHGHLRGAPHAVHRTFTAAHDTSFNRAIVIVLDGVGVGELPDAGAYGDEGSDTLGHIARRVPLRVPTLRSLGLGRVANLGDSIVSSAAAAVGRMAEASAGKDSVTGHWEMMGVTLERPFPVFPQGFPAGVIREFSRQVGRAIVGNKAASGTEIIEELGSDQMRDGSLIVYTSADSVCQIAAHEDAVPVAELYRTCEIAYKLFAEGLGVGRVIARPFGGSPGRFTRTAGRRDYALPPPRETLLDRLTARGGTVVAIGKIRELFADRGITRGIPTGSDDEGMNAIERELASLADGLVFANLVDFDSKFGHRNDVEGYARNLERFDARLETVLTALRERDLLVITADHGNDPTTPSTDHSREHVPLLVTGPRVRPGADLGTRRTFADLGQTLAALFEVDPLACGTSFLSEVAR